MYKKLEGASQVLYGCIAKEQTVLSEFAEVDGNFSVVTLQLLARGMKPDSRQSLNYKDQYHLHYHSDGGMAYLVICESDYNKRLAFMLLEDLREACNRVGINKPLELTSAIKDRVNFYNNNPDIDKLATVRRNILEVNSIMLLNIDKVLARGTKIEILVAKTEHMEEKAIEFRKKAVEVKRFYCWKSLKVKIFLAFVLLIILAIVIDLILCSGTICFTFA